MGSGSYELCLFASAGELVQAAAHEWLLEFESARARDQRLCVALCGGRIARDFFQALVEKGRKIPTAFTDVHFFWADERCVPPGDAESNFALAEDSLLRPLGIQAERVHRIRGEDDPEQAVRRAEEELRG